jgi:hypothetical protein
MAPRRTAGAINFEQQLDAAFPERGRPDGWIGDGEHRSRTSSHNPDDTPGSRPEWDGDPDTVPDVRAVDVSDDLGPGVDSQNLVDHLVRLPRLATVIRYIIHRGRIWHTRNAFRPGTHDGDPHNEHVHVTFAFTEAADDDTTYDYRMQEVPVALTAEDKKWISTEIQKYVGDVVDRWTANGDNRVRTANPEDPNPQITLREAAYYIGATVAQIRAKVNELAT